MVLAVIAVTRTGTQEGLGTEESTTRGAPTAALGAESSTGILQRHRADQLSSLQAAQATQTCSRAGSAPMGEVPLAEPADHPSQGRSSWKGFGPTACGCQKALTACGKIQLCSRHGCWGLCGTGNSLASSLQQQLQGCLLYLLLLHLLSCAPFKFPANLLTCFFPKSQLSRDSQWQVIMGDGFERRGWSDFATNW